jgi:formylglycine-generating enzyme required for sulfatase activity
LSRHVFALANVGIIAFVVLFQCTHDNALSQEHAAARMFQPVCLIDKNVAIGEVDNAVAVVKGDGIADSLVFDLFIDLAGTPKKLSGVLELPETGSHWTIIIRMFDFLHRRIGQGTLEIDDTYFKAGKYTFHDTIAIYSALPIANAGTDTVVGLGETIRLHFKGSDESAIVKSEFKIGSSDWVTTEASDTSFIAPATCQPLVCWYRVTDNDGNAVVDTMTVIVKGEKRLGMTRILAAGQKFVMGQAGVAGPVHEVMFAHDFWMDTTEVTQKQFVSIMATIAREGWVDKYGVGDNYPAYSITWRDAVAYCNALSKLNNLDTVYTLHIPEWELQIDTSKNGFRLPTEAEWEYACRARTTTDYYWGDFNAEDFTWSHHFDGPMNPVAQLKPNAFGLYDMCGNVLELCNDWYAPEYESSQQVDPWGPATGTLHVCRGGSFKDESYSLLRSACRSHEPEYENGLGFDYLKYGFRVVLPIR